MRQPFTSPEQDRGCESGMTWSDQRPNPLLGTQPGHIEKMRETPPTAVLQRRNGLWRLTANANQLPIAPCMLGKIEFARIQLRRDPSQLPEDSQMIALMYAEHVPLNR